MTKFLAGLFLRLNRWEAEGKIPAASKYVLIAAPHTTNWDLFYFLAILSINLAVINVLPIPMLDGGHLTFLLIEKIKGSPVSTKVHNYSQILGLVFVLALMVYVTYNDLLRWLF